ncbi:hypothetical protein Q5752_006220 [Cryptotrichosporon argae]
MPKAMTTYLHLPVSPPAPHRRAPRPPTYQPRRPRSRHMRMLEPALVGLFTVCEADEDAAAVFACTAPAPTRFSASTFTSQIDFSRPRSWASISDLGSCPTATDGGSGSDWEGAEPEPATPSVEDDDPFERARAWTDSIDDDDGDDGAAADALAHAIAALGASIKTVPPPIRPRRPPPLDLSAFREQPPVRSPRTPITPSPAPAAASAGLLPALPIGPVRRKRSARRAGSPCTPTVRRRRASSESPAYSSSSPCSPQSPVDLSSALRDLLVSCGEDDGLSASSLFESDEEDAKLPALSFPLPPSRASPSSSPPPLTPATPWSAELRTPGSDVFGPLVLPRTPPRRPAPAAVVVPGSPYTRAHREPITPSFAADHSFLQSLSACARPDPDSPRAQPSPASSMSSLACSTASSAGSASSRSSGRSLPRRAALPKAWMYGQPF